MLMFPLAAIQSDMQRRMREVIKQAALRSYGSIGAACIDMQIPQPHFNRALDGERGLPPGFLNLSAEFWSWFAVGLAEEFGLPKQVKSAFKLMLGVMGRRRIVPAHLGQKEVA